MTALVGAAVATRQWPGLWIVALGGFLARGGIVLLVLPMAPLPSTVGLATLVGPTSVTAAGLTPDSVVRLLVVVTLGVAWLLAGNAVGAMTDLAVVGALGPAAGPAGRRGGLRRIARLVGLRLVALLPLVVVVAFTARSVGDLVYHELVLPRDLATPLVLRVVQGAQLQVASLALAWIAGEVLGGIAVRLAVLEDRPFVGAIAGAVVHVVRNPLRTLVATVAGLVALIVALGPALLAVGAVWAALGVALNPFSDGWVVVGATVAFVGAWVGCAILAAIVAVWRAALWTGEVVRARPSA